MTSQKKSASAPANPATSKRLAKYREKRDFEKSPEPNGSGGKQPHRGKQGELAFAIQKHAASRLHYDFRLEWDGVLKSWAIAKGPSYYPGDKRLAIQVEDHPLEYGSFEGTIPKGQYGGGSVMLWDRGSWEPIGDTAEGLRKGSLKFVLHGEKLHGHWALVRMAGKFANQSKPSWLLIKEHDGNERTADEIAITEEAPNSVLTGRDIDAIAKAHGVVWNSTAGQSEDRNSLKRTEAHRAIHPHASKARSPDSHSYQLAHLPREKLPSFVSPQLASMAKLPPNGEGWVHELKLDGYRIQARIQAGKQTAVQLLTRTALDWTHRLRSVAEAIGALGISALFDGEVVVLSSDGKTSFADLQAAFQDGARFPLTYFIFDLLHLEGRNLRELPLLKRKEILSKVLSDAPPAGPLRLSEHMTGDGGTVFEHSCKLGAEGIVSKLAHGKYVSGRGNNWLKFKCYREQEFVIGGFTLPSNGTRGIGALLLGYYKEGALLYAGRTGTGFTQKTHRLVRDRLESIRSERSPFATVPGGMGRGVYWVKPRLVAQVAFANWTADNLVRQAAFKGLREDKPPKAVEQEPEKPLSSKATKAEARRKSVQGKAGNEVQRSTDPNASPLPMRLTHPGKVLDVESGLTKEALAHYYAEVASHMLPHIADRPLTLVRCMDGNSKPCFFQRHANETLPPGIKSIDVVDKKTSKPEPYITLSTPEALVELAQINVLEIHSWGSPNDSLETPDRIVIDLDPDPAIDWKTLASAAIEVRQRMKAVGLAPFLKSTGGKGLHVVAAIRPEHDWAAVKDFAHRMVLAMEADNPSLFLTKMTKAARKGKIYLDYLRNERGATSIAPFSPRAREGIPVALPLDWSELKLQQRPVFRVSNYSAWKKRLNSDPWKGMMNTSSRLKV
ncbi:MAG: DNA ligase D [Terracidiphilus sp.]|jgi:bifunctional non-homologous end joining protein LigD